MNYNCGIYQIRNLVTGRVYIGSSYNLKGRRDCHYSIAKDNKHFNSHLQRSYNKYGKDNFVFEPLLYCEEKDLIYYEQKILDYKRPNVYNLRLECVETSKGIKRSDETKKKRQNSIVGIFKGINNPMYGKKHSQETIEKIKEKLKGKKQPREIIEKQIESRKKKVIERELNGMPNPLCGRKQSEESNKKRSETLKGINCYIFGKHFSKEAIEKRTASRKRNREMKLLDLY